MSGAETLPIRRSPAEIMDTVCRHWGITRQELTSARQPKSHHAARNFAMYLLKILTPSTSGGVGRLMNRDPTTVLKAWKTIEAAIETDDGVARLVGALLQQLGALPAQPPAGGERESAAAAAVAEMAAADRPLAEALDAAGRAVNGATPWGSVTAESRLLAEGVIALQRTLAAIAAGAENPQALARSILGLEPEDGGA